MELRFQPPSDLSVQYSEIRATTERLAGPLSPEDQSIQSMPDASPARWHRAHTTWFFETFVLTPYRKGFQPFHPGYRALFNSYYDAIGDRHARPLRGVLSRPGNEEVAKWRRSVDDQVLRLIEDAPLEVLRAVTLGLHHEQQHQELLITDIKHAFSLNELRPVYLDRPTSEPSRSSPLLWQTIPEGVVEIGHVGDDFAYDNEQPRHRVLIPSSEIASRAVTNAEYLAFVHDGGYRRPELWLSDGWAAVQREGWAAPLYWECRDDVWWTFTLAGIRPLVAAEPVCHVSFYEAEAFARWAKARLPTEAEWESAAVRSTPSGAFLESGRFHPAIASDGFGGNVWEWTRSAYDPYPGYRPWDGAIGEYNGKFMSGQQVLRGGSCVTPRTHVRPTYRNFFPPGARWQFSGIRLARDF